MVVIPMVKYRCVKSDIYGGVYWDGRTYVEEGIKDARKRAMKMIHGDKEECVLIWLESDFKKRPWIGYREKVTMFANKYCAHNKNGSIILNNDGSTNPQYRE